MCSYTFLRLPKYGVRTMLATIDSEAKQKIPITKLGIEMGSNFKCMKLSAINSPISRTHKTPNTRSPTFMSFAIEPLFFIVLPINVPTKHPDRAMEPVSTLLKSNKIPSMMANSEHASKTNKNFLISHYRIVLQQQCMLY